MVEIKQPLPEAIQIEMGGVTLMGDLVLVPDVQGIILFATLVDETRRRSDSHGD